MKFLIRFASQSPIEELPYLEVRKEEWAIQPPVLEVQEESKKTETQWLIEVNSLEEMLKISSHCGYPLFLVSRAYIDQEKYLDSFLLPPDYQLDGAIGIYDEETEKHSSISEK